MIEKIQKATASSPEGAKGLVRGILACAFQNVAFMLPTSLLYCLVRDLMAGTTVGRAGFYTTGCIGCFGSLISTTLISLSLFVFDWRMALGQRWTI